MGVSATDFEYDGQRLSSRGMIICSFDSKSGVTNSEPGSVITFNRVQRNGGRHHSMSSAVFNDCYTAVFHICKDPCQVRSDLYEEMKISSDEYRSLMRWLNRREFLPFRLYDEDLNGSTYYYDASFNIKKIFVGDVLYGLELSMETDGPFAYGEEVIVSGTIGSAGSSLEITDTSDDVGYLYPEVRITATGAGDISITSSYDNAATTIKNCTAGEVITLSGDAMTITSSVSTHNIANDFNYEFLKIGNTMENNVNTITASAPCQVTLRYHPIIKEVF